MFIEFSRQRGLAPDGRCKSFAEAADGVGWAEGVGSARPAAPLRRETRRPSDPRRAQGLAPINQDGASNGFTAPNGPSQERVIRQALANARLEPKDVDAVEAHGTGTTLGDPIEAGALLATYGQEREDGPLRLGSIKSNIGHTQAAAGVAGVIKMVQAMRHGVLPRTLHLDQPSSKVDWDSGEIELLAEAQEWKPNGRPRRAGVSSFGISGTNAHVILEEAPEVEPIEVKEGLEPPLAAPIALPLSAKSEPALRQAAANLASHLEENPELELSDVSFSLAATRAQFEQRAVLLGTERGELLERLRALASGEPVAGVIEGRAQKGKLAFLFTGQGSQRAAMGKELYEASPPFAKALDRACEALDPHLPQPLKEVLFAAEGSPEAELLEHTAFTQPALFAIEVALHALTESLAIRPDYLAGHSVGEIAAAHLAGVLSLPDAAKLVAARGKLMGQLPAGGAMIAIEAPEEEVAEAIAAKEAELSIAAVNGPTSIVISGRREAAEEVQERFEAQGKKTKRLAVSHAFHSPLMEPMLAEFAEVAKSLAYEEPKIAILSNLSGEVLTKEQATDPAYWVSHARGAVRFKDTVATLDRLGTTTYLELGPEGVLSAMAASCLPEGSGAKTIAALRSAKAEPEALIAALSAAHASGAKLDLAALHPAAKRVSLPTYPFQRERYWIASAIGTADASSIGQRGADHPLLAAAIEDPSGEGALTLTGSLSLATHPWLADHAVLGTVILPGTAFLEMAFEAAEQAGAQTIEELTLQAPLLLAESGAVSVQVSVSAPGERGNRPISIYSRTETEEEAGEWTLHATGSLGSEQPPEPEPLTAWPPQGAEPIQIEDLYEGLAEIGFEYGPAFQGVSAAWQANGEIYAEVSLADAQSEEAGRFSIHPALLDSAFHAGLGAALGSEDAKPIIPFDWHGVSVFAAGATTLRVRASMEDERLRLLAADPSGMPVLQIDSLLARPVERDQLQSAHQARRDLFALDWVEISPGEEPLALGILGEEAIEGISAAPHPDLDALLRHGASGEDVPEVLLIDARLWGAGEEEVEAAHASAVRGLELIQDLLSREVLEQARLAFLTEGALSTSTEQRPSLAQATLAGLLRSAQSEHPGRFALIDTDGTEASAQALPAALAASAEEPQLALREGELLAPRLIDAPEPGEAEGEGAPLLDPEKTVLITGATGALGALFARHLVERHGARHLLLVSRSGPEAKGAKELEEELGELGAEVQIAACDVAEREQLRELLASISEEHPLGAVVHAAGVLADGTVETMVPEQIDRVFAPKAQGAWNLHELTAGLDLSAFVMFSSIAAVFGGPGQANYAAANAFLDALAHAAGTPPGPAGRPRWPWGLWDAGQRDLAAGPERGRGRTTPASDREAGSASTAIRPVADGLALFDAACGASASRSWLPVTLRPGGAARRERTCRGRCPGCCAVPFAGGPAPRA